MTNVSLDDQEASFLSRAIDLSASCLRDPLLTPFGAVLVLRGEVIGEGVSSPVRLFDPTAHAEVLALRAAGMRQQHHQFPGAVLYVNGFPCPMCLVACQWASVSRIVAAATVADSQAVGFEDSLYYDRLRDPQVGTDLVRVAVSHRVAANEVLQRWRASI